MNSWPLDEWMLFRTQIGEVAFAILAAINVTSRVMQFYSVSESRDLHHLPLGHHSASATLTT